MTFDIQDKSTHTWVDITPYIAFQGFEGTRNDVDGPTAGRVIQDALMTRDRLATKYKFTITTKPIPMDVALMIENLLMPEFFYVRTDWFASSITQYECYSNNVTKAYLLNQGNGTELIKLSFPIVER